MGKALNVEEQMETSFKGKKEGRVVMTIKERKCNLLENRGKCGFMNMVIIMR